MAEVPDPSNSTQAWASIDPTNPLIVTWTWTINPQPDWEVLDLYTMNWDLTNVGGDSAVQRMELASNCVPEPTTFVLLTGLLGLLAIGRWRR
jgi:hypothetical protein